MTTADKLYFVPFLVAILTIPVASCTLWGAIIYAIVT